MADSTLEWSNLRYTPTEYKRIELVSLWQTWHNSNSRICLMAPDVTSLLMCVLQTNRPHIITSDLHSYKCVY